MIRNAINRRREGRSDAGFTLIELLIVIVILGILAAIVVFSVRGITDRGNTSACKANIATLETAVEAYYAKTGAYPTAIGDLTAGDDQFLKSAPPAGYITFIDADTAPTIKAASTC